MQKTLFILILLALIPDLYGQDLPGQIESATAYQRALDATYAHPDSTILSNKQLKTFTTLGFFPIDLKYCVTAKFERTPKAQPFMMNTSSGLSREYVTYGLLHFEIDGISCVLPVYQNTRYLIETQNKYAKSLFLPFTDYTSGVTTYGGGRYLELWITDIINDSVILDFNKSYNPYCAYTNGYSCPIPPEANDLKVAIRAGVKAYPSYE